MNNSKSHIKIGKEIFNAHEIRSIECDNNFCRIGFRSQYYFGSGRYKYVFKKFDAESYENVKSFYDNLSKPDGVNNQ